MSGEASGPDGGVGDDARPDAATSDKVGSVRPTDAQRRYLQRGLTQPGGKLPLFEPDGREVPRKTITSCMAHGWAEPWVNNPVNPEWVVCKLTPEGYRILGVSPKPVEPKG